MQKTIKLPKTVKDLRISHFKSFSEFDDEDMDLSAKVRFVASFTGRSVNFIWSIEKDVFDKMYSHIVKLIATMKINSRPPKEITIDGVEYDLIDPNKCANAWHQDWNLFDIEKDPVKLACLFYHPKGHFYGEIDANDNLIHPVRWKYQHFKHEMELSTFIECATFFLQSYAKSIEQSTRIEIARIKTENLLKHLPSFVLKKQPTQ